MFFILINYFTIIFSNAIFLVYICIFTNLFDYLYLYIYIYLLINVILVCSSSITHLFLVVFVHYVLDLIFSFVFGLFL